jgi:hypothetical protein
MKSGKRCQIQRWDDHEGSSLEVGNHRVPANLLDIEIQNGTKKPKIKQKNIVGVVSGNALRKE